MFVIVDTGVVLHDESALVCQVPPLGSGDCHGMQWRGMTPLLYLTG